MNLKKNILQISMFSFGFFAALQSEAQDTIIKTNGDLIYAKVLEIGTNGVSYKKSGFEEGPTYVEEKSNMVAIKFKNGTREVFSPQATAPKQTSSYVNSETQTPRQPATNNPLSSGPVKEQTRIEHLNKRYTVNGQKASPKDVDRLLASSSNPAVKVMAKTAKASKTLQKVIGYTSIPSTISGGVASAFTFVNMFTSIAKTGTASPDAYLSAGMSLLGTITLPITNKILKNRRDKLYDKAIDLYNMGEMKPALSVSK
jgi:hypothetical protein